MSKFKSGDVVKKKYPKIGHIIHIEEYNDVIFSCPCYVTINGDIYNCHYVDAYYRKLYRREKLELL